VFETETKMSAFKALHGCNNSKGIGEPGIV